MLPSHVRLLETNFKPRVASSTKPVCLIEALFMRINWLFSPEKDKVNASLLSSSEKRPSQSLLNIFSISRHLQILEYFQISTLGKHDQLE